MKVKGFAEAMGSYGEEAAAGARKKSPAPHARAE
jgi:hypothetical protein